MKRALSLFSGGLDSILATRLIMAQGIDVLALQFVTPFFNDGILADIEAHREKIARLYGIKVRVEDISEGYLELLHNPKHGFGKNFNPCIDCKIMMLQRAKALMAELGASFLVSGEVLGQRPMSQRRDTLNVIERDSATTSILLRPLCAKLMKETLPEARGWVDRNKLLAFSGRSRSPQMALAREFRISDYPAPAGGCVLADPILSKRIKALYQRESISSSASINQADIRGMLVGRQLVLPGGGWLILGRDEKDNRRLESLAGEEDALIHMEKWPGPTAILKKTSLYPDRKALQQALQLAFSLVVRYSKKVDGKALPQEVICNYKGQQRVVVADPFAGDRYRGWILD